MLYVYEGRPLKVSIEFRGTFNLVVADRPDNTDLDNHPGLMIAIYRGGVPVHLANNLDPGGGTQYLYTVPEDHVKLVDSQLATRYELVATYNYEQGRYSGSVPLPYTVLKYIPHGAVVDDVRNHLGLTSIELPEALIDLSAAYLGVLWDVGDEVFEPAAEGGGQKAESCRQIVSIRAAQDLLPSLRVRVAQQLVDGTRQFSRFRNTDIEDLGYDLSELYGYHRGVITDSAEGDLGFFTTSSQADPFTG